MDDLTDDEYTVLMIAAEGQSMIPIGRWEKPVKTLVANGYLESHNLHNNTITAAGRVALERRELADKTALRNAGKNIALAMNAQSVEQMLEPIIQALADGVTTIAKRNNVSPRTAVEQFFFPAISKMLHERLG